MKRLTKGYLPAVLALPILLGAVSGLVRVKVVQGAVDMQTGFLKPDGSMLALYAVIAICLLCLAGLSAMAKGRPLNFVPHAASTPRKLATVVSSLLLFVSAALTFVQMRGNVTVLPLITAIFLACCGATQLVALKNCRDRAIVGFCTLFPVFFMGFFMLLYYRKNANNPLIFSFAIEMISTLLLMFAVYTASSAYFTRTRPVRYVFFSAAALYGMTLIGVCLLVSPAYFGRYINMGWPELAMIAAFLLMQFTSLFDAASAEAKGAAEAAEQAKKQQDEQAMAEQEAREIEKARAELEGELPSDQE